MNNTSQSPITDVLNLAASAISLRDDFAMCEKVINEKHQFLVAMLDGMDKKIMGFSENQLNLEKRVESLEKSKDYSFRVVQDTLSEIKIRQADVDQKMMGIVEGSSRINDMIKSCGQYSGIPERIMNIENRLEQDTTRCTHQCSELTEKKSVAIYGLPDYDDVNNIVNRLFHDINLTVKCQSAYRTPTRAHGNRVGVVIAELYSIEDKRSVLERKRNLRTIPIYANVFIRAAKSHTEQVMESNFGVILSEMTNGEAFHISDNGRILRTTRNHGGARPNTTRYNSHTDQIPRYNNKNTNDTSQNLHHRISHGTSHMVPQRPNNRTSQHQQHHTILHDLHHSQSQDPKNKTPQDYPSITHHTNHMTSQDPYHRTPHGYYHMTSQDSHQDTSQYPQHTISQDRHHNTSKGDTHRFMQKTPNRTLKGIPHNTPQNTYNRSRQHGSHMNILDHQQTLHSKGHGTSYIANQRDYVEDRYDFNAAYDAYSQQCTNRFINPYNQQQVKHTTNEHITKN